MSETTHIDGWPQPYPQLDAEPYWAALQERRLTYQHCTACEQAVWPAHSFCPHCGAQRQRLQWRESSGRGTVYSHSTVMRGATPAWAAIAPYTVGFIEMAEGYYLFSQINSRPEDIRIGQHVQVQFLQRGRQILPVFDPTD
jgi:uncharacterized OB-fold protein